MALNISTSVAKELKLKVRKFWGLTPTFVDVTGEKLVVRPFCPTPIKKVCSLRNGFFTTIACVNFTLSPSLCFSLMVEKKTFCIYGSRDPPPPPSHFFSPSVYGHVIQL